MSITFVTDINSFAADVSFVCIHCCYRQRAKDVPMQSLAAEVVALEEKVLQVRSREIRLDKETGRLKEGLQQAEQQLQSSRQDRANLQATIDMLQVCAPCL